MNNFTFTLKIARTQQNLTQAELALVADVSQMTISHIENGVHRPQASTKEKLEKILGSIDWERTTDEGMVRRQTLIN